MDSDADDEPRGGETERPSLFGAVMRGANGGTGQNRRVRRRAHNNDDNGVVANDDGDHVFGRGGGIDVVEATRFPSANDNVDMSTPSPKSRRGGRSRGRDVGTGSASGERRSGGLFGGIGGGDGSNSGSNSRFAGVVSPGGYGMMNILNNLDADTHHFYDSNFDKVESPSKGGDHGEKGGEEDEEEEEDADDAPPMWKEAAFVAPTWLPMNVATVEHTTPDGASSRSGASDNDIGNYKEEEGGTEIQNVRIKRESPSKVQHDNFDEDENEDGDVYDLPTQPPADPNQKKRKRMASRAETAVPTDNVSSQTGPDALAPPVMSIGVLDWTLKRRLRLECSPRRALPLSSLWDYSTSPGGHEAVDRLAAHIFLHPGAGIDDVGNDSCPDLLRPTADMPAADPMTIVAAQWKAAQMYWRHPAVYPLPSKVLVSSVNEPSNAAVGNTRSNNPAKKALRFASSSTRSSTEEEAAAIRGAADVIQQRQAASLSAMGFGSSAVARFGETSSTLLALVDGPSEIIRRRQSEWAEAFRSIYYTWLERIDELRKARHEFLSVDHIARTYFYLVSPSQTILFRCQVQCSRKDDVEDEDNTCTIDPVILLSSTTSRLRSELRGMGVSIYVLDDASTDRLDQDDRIKYNLFDDSIFDIKPDEMKRSKAEEAEAHKVREELEALRRAGAQGHTAGAEVSVSIGKRKGLLSQGAKGKEDNQIFRPLYVKGDDDCMAIYELLLNTGGRLFCGEDDGDGDKSDVPLLLHRSLGPTKSAVIGTLSETMRLDENYRHLKMMRDQEVKTSDAASDDETFAKLQINGPILPCAVRDLMSASICHLLLDKMNVDGVSEEQENVAANNDGAGSHYLVWYPTSQEGFAIDNSLSALKSKSSGREHTQQKVIRRLAMYKRETGNPTSSRFNGGDLDQDLVGVGNCGSHQLLKQLLWVSTHQNKLLYTTTSALG